MFLQAELMRDGDAVERRRLLKIAALAGVPEAQYNYASMCFHGEGGPVDQVEGGRMVMWAATNGDDPEAQVLVARAYAEHDDRASAAKFYRAAAAPMPPADRAQWAQLEADPLAEPDAELVVHLRQRQRAPDGHAEAQRQLAFLYARGEGVPKDAVRALAWCKMAARQGDFEAENLEPTYAAAAGASGAERAGDLVGAWLAGRRPEPDLPPVW